MAYFEDLSVYTYFSHTGNKTKNVGWLDRSHQFPQATPPDDLLDLIREHCKKPTVQTFGIHHCEWCPAGTKPQVDRVGCRVLLGSAEIRVFPEDGMIYAAPNLIYHYVSVHHYKPPDEFIRALNNGPRPTSPEYAERLREWEHGWDLTFVRDFSDCCRKAHEMSMPGYSGTPLTKKLGIKDDFRVALLHVPDDVKTELRDALANCRIQPFTNKDKDLDFIFLFAKSRAGLELELRSSSQGAGIRGHVVDLVAEENFGPSHRHHRSCGSAGRT